MRIGAAAGVLGKDLDYWRPAVKSDLKDGAI
jgi:hypothetical protein